MRIVITYCTSIWWTLRSFNCQKLACSRLPPFQEPKWSQDQDSANRILFSPEFFFLVLNKQFLHTTPTSHLRQADLVCSHSNTTWGMNINLSTWKTTRIIQLVLNNDSDSKAKSCSSKLWQWSQPKSKITSLPKLSLLKLSIAIYMYVSPTFINLILLHT